VKIKQQKRKEVKERIVAILAAQLILPEYLQSKLVIDKCNEALNKIKISEEEK
jgi:hypothetical protein